MPYVIDIDDVSSTMELIEKRLYACGLDRAVAILRNALSDGHNVQFIEKFTPTVKLSLINYDGMISAPKTTNKREITN
jgi:hypothetical protein